MPHTPYFINLWTWNITFPNIFLQNKAVDQNVTTEFDITLTNRLRFLCYWVRPCGSCHSPVLTFPRLLIPAPLACTRAWWATSLDSTRVCERRAREWESRTEELCVIFSYRKKIYRASESKRALTISTLTCIKDNIITLDSLWCCSGALCLLMSDFN